MCGWMRSSDYLVDYPVEGRKVEGLKGGSWQGGKTGGCRFEGYAISCPYSQDSGTPLGLCSIFRSLNGFACFLFNYCLLFD